MAALQLTSVAWWATYVAVISRDNYVASFDRNDALGAATAAGVLTFAIITAVVLTWGRGRG